MEELSAHLQDKEVKEAEAHLSPQYQPKKAKQQQHGAEQAGPSKHGHLREFPPNFERNVLLMAKQQAQRKLSAKPQAQRALEEALEEGLEEALAAILEELAAHSQAQRAGQAGTAQHQAGTAPHYQALAPLPSVASDKALSVLFSLCQALSPLLASLEEVSALPALASVEELSALSAELILLEDLLLTMEAPSAEVILLGKLADALA